MYVATTTAECSYYSTMNVSTTAPIKESLAVDAISVAQRSLLAKLLRVAAINYYALLCACSLTCTALPHCVLLNFTTGGTSAQVPPPMAY